MSYNIPFPDDHFLCSICMEVFTHPVSIPCGHSFCKACITRYWDTSGVPKCPLCQKTFRRMPEVSVNTFISKVADQFRNQKLKEEFEAKTVAEVQQMIQERRAKIREVELSVKLIGKECDAVKAVGEEISATLVRCIVKSQAQFSFVIEEKRKTTETQGKGYIKELKQEIIQLEERISELEQVSRLEYQLPQNFTPTNTLPPTKDWTMVNTHQPSLVETLRTTVNQLGKALRRNVKKRLRDAELRRAQQYTVNVNVAPGTAHCRVILTEDGQQVSCGNTVNSEENAPNDPERFAVLGEQGFSSGRFYYEVLVGGKAEWRIGVVRGSIIRNARVMLTPANGFWTISLRNGQYMSDVLLPVTQELKRVGVFVDYEEGLVSFYDVEARALLYSFTGCSFNERLYPYFS